MLLTPENSAPSRETRKEHGNHPLTVRQIDRPDDFLELGEAWNALVADRSVFLRHEWFDAAWQWRQHDKGTRLALFCVYRGTALVGVCPLIARDERRKGLLHRTFEFLTVPDNQLCDIIVAGHETQAVAEALAEALISRRSDWDVLRLAYLPDNSVAAGALDRALARHGIARRTRSAGGNAFVWLTNGWDDYYATRSRRLKQANNLNANRLKKAGQLTIDWMHPGNTPLAAWPPALETVIAISARSWKRSTHNSLNNPGPQAFIRRLTELAIKREWLSIWLLSLDGKPLAMEFQLIFAGKVHALRADIVEGDSEISPGSHLNRHLLEQLFGRGLQQYLMGPGDNAYKKRWTDLSEPVFQFDAFSPSLRGQRAALWELRLKPALRRLRNKLFRNRKEVAE